jgi:hypothetical protein
VASSNDRPSREFRAGPLFAAVWTESRKVGSGEAVVHSIRIQKRYRDERSGQWKSTSYLRPDDLQKLALLASRIYEDIFLRTDVTLPADKQQS